MNGSLGTGGQAKIFRAPGITVLVHHKGPVSSSVFSSSITLCLTFISNFQERRNPNLKSSRAFLSRKRKKSLEVPREGRGWNQACPAAILRSVLWSQFRKAEKLSPGKLRWGGGGWGQDRRWRAGSRSPLGSQITAGPLVPGTLGLPACGGWVCSHVPGGLSLCSYVCLLSGLRKSVGWSMAHAQLIPQEHWVRGCR